MKKLIIYIHGKGGNINEAIHYKTIFKECKIIGFDYKSNTPWEAKKEFSNYFDKICNNYESIEIIANSIGAFFAMCSLFNKKIERAYFISPIVDMQKLISDMMLWANVTETELSTKKEIKTDFGETLSWKYLCYVRENPIVWNIPTYILYGKKDNLTNIDTISNFAKQINAPLTIMKDGEHWFHTENQMNFLDNWLKNCITKY